MEMTSQSPDLENEIHDFLSRLARKRLFETEWDIAAFAIFFIFMGECIAQHEARARQLLSVLGLAGNCPNPSNSCSPPAAQPWRKNGRVQPLHLHSADKASNGSKDTGAQRKHSPCNLPWLRDHFHSHAATLPNTSRVWPAWAQMVFVGLPCPV